MKATLTEKDIPTASEIKNVNGQNEISALLFPESDNILRISNFTSTDWKSSSVFSVAS